MTLKKKQKFIFEYIYVHTCNIFFIAMLYVWFCGFTNFEITIFVFYVYMYTSSYFIVFWWDCNINFPRVFFKIDGDHRKWIIRSVDIEVIGYTDINKISYVNVSVHVTQKIQEKLWITKRRRQKFFTLLRDMWFMRVFILIYFF